MKNFVILAALAGAIILPSMPLAADTPASGTTSGTMTSGTMICHAARAGETPDAMIGSSGMMCKKVDVATVHAAISKMRAAMTKMQGDNPTAEQKAAAATCKFNLNRIAVQYWL